MCPFFKCSTSYYPLVCSEFQQNCFDGAVLYGGTKNNHFVAVNLLVFANWHNLFLQMNHDILMSIESRDADAYASLKAGGRSKEFWALILINGNSLPKINLYKDTISSPFLLFTLSPLFRFFLLFLLKTLIFDISSSIRNTLTRHT